MWGSNGPCGARMGCVGSVNGLAGVIVGYLGCELVVTPALARVGLMFVVGPLFIIAIELTNTSITCEYCVSTEYCEYSGCCTPESCRY